MSVSEYVDPPKRLSLSFKSILTHGRRFPIIGGLTAISANLVDYLLPISISYFNCHVSLNYKLTVQHIEELLPI